MTIPIGWLYTGAVAVIGWHAGSFSAYDRPKQHIATVNEKAPAGCQKIATRERL